MPVVPAKKEVISRLKELSQAEEGQALDRAWWEAARLVQSWLMVDTRRQIDDEILSIWTPDGWAKSG